MPRVNWITKIKENLLAAACTAAVTVCMGVVSMVLIHDKKIDRIEDKLNIVLIHVAPQAAAAYGITSIESPKQPTPDPQSLPHMWGHPPKQEQSLATKP